MSETVRPIESATALELAAAILQQFPRDLSQEQGRYWIGNKKQLGRGLSNLLKSVPGKPAKTPEPIPAPEKLLELVTTVSLPAVEAFKAADHFKEGRKAPGGINLWLGPNFKAWFLGGTGKIEIDVPAADLRVHKLLKRSVDDPIIKELGEEAVAETKLAHLWELVKKQPNGKPGTLLNTGWWNFFYILTCKDVLCAVSCSWDSDNRYWNVEAYPFGRPYGWWGDGQVFSG